MKQTTVSPHEKCQARKHISHKHAILAFSSKALLHHVLKSTKGMEPRFQAIKSSVGRIVRAIGKFRFDIASCPIRVLR